MKKLYSVDKASVSDIKEIIKLRVSLLKEVNEIQTEEEEAQITHATKNYLETEISNHNFVSYIAKKDEEVVSVSGVSFFKRPPYLENLQGIEAYILNMYTLPSHRNQGLARQLLEKCIEECKKRDVKRIWLHASKDGEPLYKSMGFNFKGSEMELFL
ncbi:GNAT family N-acetyltransferase [Priestia aryabhattai]|uniref:GNAT family N-acetyltransferase n=1 Tax=Priestia aryabhattai TaxID=412384 RepID=A0ABD7X432_PRIAR|nr:GNAT family N-acetyltransferase [Priestia aryabhattai]WEA47113.1 GNAT family N-acetyltransferase [Priestia aryabhattai]